MPNITLEVPINIDTIIKGLTIEDKIKIIRKLQKETRRQRWEPFLNRIAARKKTARTAFSAKEITRIVKDVRKELYG